jgi:heptosyltransferase-2
MSIAIIKPDHLGDLVLSIPAIRAIAQGSQEAVLYVGPWNRKAAAYFFPGLQIETMVFSHLSKADDAHDDVPDLRDFDCAVILRNDHIINQQWADLRARDYFVIPPRNDVHQSVLDYTAARSVVDEYDMDALYYGANMARFLDKLDRPVKQVGLSIGSGFHANLWPTQRWVELGRLFIKDGLAVRIITGPSERDRANYVADRLGLARASNIISGSGDLAGFIEQVAEMDLVVASDGGAAHLCSLVAPIISVFGPSPFRRYAPFGRANRLITRGLSCSPCCQYATNLLNGCLTMECMVGVSADAVWRGSKSKTSLQSAPRSQMLEEGLQMWWGLSHIDRYLVGYGAS